MATSIIQAVTFFTSPLEPQVHGSYYTARVTLTDRGKEDVSADSASHARLARDSQLPAPPAFCSVCPDSRLCFRNLCCSPMPLAAPLTTDSTAGQSQSEPVFLPSLREHSLGSGTFEILTLGNSVCEHRLTFGERTK